jgi:hypothetical protein
MQPASFGVGRGHKAAIPRPETKEKKMMRVISTSELSRLTRAQLFALYTQMQAVLADLPQGSPESEFVIGTLANIKLVLFRRRPAPAP